jgi:hypothetical protein
MVKTYNCKKISYSDRLMHVPQWTINEISFHILLLFGNSVQYYKHLIALTYSCDSCIMSCVLLINFLWNEIFHHITAVSYSHILFKDLESPSQHFYFFVTHEFAQNAKVFAPVWLFKHSPMYESKDTAERCFIWVDSCLTQKQLARVNRPARSKHSSLLGPFKKMLWRKCSVFITAPGTNTKNFLLP